MSIDLLIWIVDDDLLASTRDSSLCVPVDYIDEILLETKVYGFTEQIYSTLSFQQRVAFFDVLSLSLAFLGLSSSWRSQQHSHFISH